MSLVDEIRKLAELRKARDEYMRQLSEAKARFEKENAGLIEGVRALKEAVAEKEGEVKEAALAEFLETGDRGIAPGIKFRITKVARFDPEKAYAWALEHQEKKVLKLDERAFERLVKKANPDLLVASGIDFVELDEEPVPTLASNLEAALYEYETTQTKKDD